jgi:chromosome segregation ATPase
MDRMQDNLEALVEKYQLDRQQLDKDIEEYATKKQHLDQLVKRLEASEAQYKDRQEALEWEVARLESQHKADGKTHEALLHSKVEEHQQRTDELRNQHQQVVQTMSQKIAVLESDKTRLEEDCVALQANFEKMQEDYSNEIENLQSAKANLEEELTNALTTTHEVQEEMIQLRQDAEQRQASQTAERTKMQGMLSRLDANEKAVSQKQKEVEEREAVVQEAGADVQARLEELIKLVSGCSFFAPCAFRFLCFNLRSDRNEKCLLASLSKTKKWAN